MIATVLGKSGLLVQGLLLAMLVAAWNGPAAAGEVDADTDAPTAESPEDEEEEQVELDTGDNAWMLTSSALVLLMTAPGLALFYCGLVRKKNVLNVMMQCVFMMALMSVLWAVFGYTLAFGGDGPIIGNLEFLFLNNVQYTADHVLPMEGSIPRLTHMLFQGMFFIITPALIVGAFAERMKFSTMVVFMALWGVLVYCPLCHCVWDGGILCDGNRYFPLGGALDFAGGTVVHISSGVSALVCALVIGKRLGYGSEPMPPHNLTYTAIGATMLWVGWFGFNAGSALAADGTAGLAFLTTNTATAAAVLGWIAIEWLHRGKPTVLGGATAAVAGLVAITPACAYVTPGGALLIGFGAAAFCYLAVTVLKPLAGYDDSLDVFGVHGVGGMWGAIATGLFIADFALPEGVSWGAQVAIQLQSVVFVALFAPLATLAILFGLKAVFGDLRVEEEDEYKGLDLATHSERAYVE